MSVMIFLDARTSFLFLTFKRAIHDGDLLEIPNIELRLNLPFSDTYHIISSSKFASGGGSPLMLWKVI